jgi:hypothetical protein
MGTRGHKGGVMTNTRHDEKVTYYSTSDDLMDVEQAVLILRRSKVKGIDRGAVIRAALKLAVPQLLASGKDSPLYRELTGTSER